MALQPIWWWVDSYVLLFNPESISLPSCRTVGHAHISIVVVFSNFLKQIWHVKNTVFSCHLISSTILCRSIHYFQSFFLFTYLSCMRLDYTISLKFQIAEGLYAKSKCTWCMEVFGTIRDVEADAEAPEVAIELCRLHSPGSNTRIFLVLSLHVTFFGWKSFLWYSNQSKIYVLRSS